MGLEIIEQVPDVDAVVIPVGGGGLIAGCAVALKTMNPNIKIIVRIKNSSYKKKNLIVQIPLTQLQRICNSHWAKGARNGVISIEQWGVFNHEKGAI